MTLDQEIDKITETVKRLPPLIGNEAVNFSLDNFRKQGWQGKTFVAWPKRKHPAAKNRGNPILVQSGALRRSIQVKNTTENSVTVGTAGQIPYARIHNEGGSIRQAARSETFIRSRYKRGKNKGRFKKASLQKGGQRGAGFTFKERIIHIPQRQFMGDSPVLRNRIERTCIDELKKALK